MGPQAAIYNGAEYVPFLFKREGTPFYESDIPVNGLVSYQHYLYNPIALQYDVSRGQVIILNYNQKTRLFLENSVIDSFYFAHHTFIRLEENASQNLTNTGFYEVLLNGNIKVLANRKKNFKETIKENQLVRIFNILDQFYIKKNGKYFEVKNQKDVFRVLGDKKNEVKRQMRQQKIKFRQKYFEGGLLVAAKIYDQLT